MFVIIGLISTHKRSSIFQEKRRGVGMRKKKDERKFILVSIKRYEKALYVKPETRFCNSKIKDLWYLRFFNPYRKGLGFPFREFIFFDSFESLLDFLYSYLKFISCLSKGL